MRPPQDLIFPRNPEEFYRLRDDRTNRCVANRGYQSIRTSVSIDSDVARTISGQAMMLTTCNLLSRWCRRVEVVCPAAAADIPSYSGRGLLKDVVIQTMCDADPFGNFCISDSATLEQPISLHIGPVPPKTRPTVVIDSGGWTASLGSSNGRIPARFRDANIIGAVGAACLGVANVFKHAIGVSENSLIADGLFDLFRLERVPEDGIFDRGPRLSNLDLGNILVVGLGSVGSSFVHCLKLSRAICQAMLVDQDLIKVENFNRSPFLAEQISR